MLEKLSVGRNLFIILAIKESFICYDHAVSNLNTDFLEHGTFQQ